MRKIIGKWKRLRRKQFTWYYMSIYIWSLALLALAWFYREFQEKSLISVIIIIGIMEMLYIALVQFNFGKVMKISKSIEQFIRSNNLYQSHTVTEQGKSIEKVDYYPIVQYQIKRKQNVFCIRIRQDGSPSAERFRGLEEPLARLFHTVCSDRIEERGYLTYCFELWKQKQIRIKSCQDIPKAGENEIAFSNNIAWNWKTCPHLLLTGITSSGKTITAQYIIASLIQQGVRVIYCDPKNDFEMRQFAENCGVVYAPEERKIAKAVRETEEEMRKRGQELDKIGIQEIDFQPLFIVFDELIAFSKIAEKKTYEETTRRIASIVVMGRSKRVYAGLILQRPDTSFIEGAIRDNLGCRICMGQMSDTAYKMAFGADFADVKNLRREIGSGLIYRQGVDSKPREFLAPYIEKGALNRKE